MDGPSAPEAALYGALVAGIAQEMANPRLPVPGSHEEARNPRRGFAGDVFEDHLQSHYNRVLPPPLPAACREAGNGRWVSNDAADLLLQAHDGLVRGRNFRRSLHVAGCAITRRGARGLAPGQAAAQGRDRPPRRAGIAEAVDGEVQTGAPGRHRFQAVVRRGGSHKDNGRGTPALKSASQ